MVELYWPRDSTFMDNQADLRFNGSGVYEVPDRLEAFYRSRGWEDPPEDHDGDVGEPDSAMNRNLSGPSRDELVQDEDDSASADDTDDSEGTDGGADADEDDSDNGGDSGN